MALNRLESEHQRSAEASKNLLLLDPVDLMKNNPGALIPNHASYQAMEKHFSEELFDPIKVAKVEVVSGNSTRIELLVVDGFTRTKFAHDRRYKDSRFARIEAIDATESYLKNPFITTEQVSGRTSLKMLYYLQAVVPATVVHAEIVQDRIAAHLINAWKGLVGEDIADKYSATAALNFLTSPTSPVNLYELEKYLQNLQIKLISGETAKQRERLNLALLQISKIVQMSRLRTDKVAQSAFMLVSKGAYVIGGEREARRETYGLLHTPVVDAKIKHAFPRSGMQEQMRIELGEAVWEAHQKFSGKSDARTLQAIHEALGDPRLNFKTTLDIFGSNSPSEARLLAIMEVNRNILDLNYRKISKKDNLSDLEQRLIERLGRVEYLEERAFVSSARIIEQANTAHLKANEYLRQLKGKRGELLKRGVSETLIDQTIELIEESSRGLLGGNNAQVLSERTQDLLNVLTLQDDKIAYQRSAFRVGRVVDKLFTEELAGKGGEQLRKSLVMYVIQYAENLADEQETANLLGNFKRLNPTYRLQVLQGDMRIARALKAQEEEQVRQRAAAVKKASPTSTARPTYTGEAKIHPKTEETPVILKKEAVNRKRVESNNDKLMGVLTMLLNVLNHLDLEASEVNPEVKEQAIQALRGVGKLTHGHPDIARVVDDYFKDHPEKMKELTKKIVRDQADLFEASKE